MKMNLIFVIFVIVVIFLLISYFIIQRVDDEKEIKEFKSIGSFSLIQKGTNICQECNSDNTNRGTYKTLLLKKERMVRDQIETIEEEVLLQLCENCSSRYAFNEIEIWSIENSNYLDLYTLASEAKSLQHCYHCGTPLNSMPYHVIEYREENRKEKNVIKIVGYAEALLIVCEKCKDYYDMKNIRIGVYEQD
jgi:hypothetical protein